MSLEEISLLVFVRFPNTSNTQGSIKEKKNAFPVAFFSFIFFLIRINYCIFKHCHNNFFFTYHFHLNLKVVVGTPMWRFNLAEPIRLHI